MLNYNKGVSLIELLVSLLIASIVVIVTLALLKNSYGIANQIKSKLDNKVYVRNFFKTLAQEVGEAGYVDMSKPLATASSVDVCKSICLKLAQDQRNIDELILKTELVDNDANRVVQLIRYKLKIMSPTRSIKHPAERAIYKSKSMRSKSKYERYEYWSSDYAEYDTLLLAGVDSFICDKKDTFNRSNSKVLKCTLKVYRSMMGDEIETFNFYAQNTD